MDVRVGLLTYSDSVWIFIQFTVFVWGVFCLLCRQCCLFCIANVSFVVWILGQYCTSTCKWLIVTEPWLAPSALPGLRGLIWVHLCFFLFFSLTYYYKSPVCACVILSHQASWEKVVEVKYVCWLCPFVKEHQFLTFFFQECLIVKECSMISKVLAVDTHKVCLLSMTGIISAKTARMRTIHRLACTKMYHHNKMHITLFTKDGEIWRSLLALISLSNVHP